MVRTEKREYNRKDVLKVFNKINDSDGSLTLNQIVFDLGPDINENIEAAVQELVDEKVIGSRDSFLKTHINFSPWDTIIYDGIADDYIGVGPNNKLYLKNKSRDEFNLSKPRTKVNPELY